MRGFGCSLFFPEGCVESFVRSPHTTRAFSKFWWQDVGTSKQNLQEHSLNFGGVSDTLSFGGFLRCCNHVFAPSLTTLKLLSHLH